MRAQARSSKLGRQEERLAQVNRGCSGYGRTYATHMLDASAQHMHSHIYAPTPVPLHLGAPPNLNQKLDGTTNVDHVVLERLVAGAYLEEKRT